VKLFRGADKSGVVNLSGLETGDRLPFLKDLTPKLTELRSTLGHPHWITLDETQDLLPADVAASEFLPLVGSGASVLHITERPKLVAREVLLAATLVIALGSSGRELLQEFAQVSGLASPNSPAGSVGRALAWRPQTAGAKPFRLNIATPQESSTKDLRARKTKV
jgi:hypothetical protein